MAHRYERVQTDDHGDSRAAGVPTSPPPSFQSRPESPISPVEPTENTALADSFDSSDDEDDDLRSHNRGRGAAQETVHYESALPYIAPSSSTPTPQPTTSTTPSGAAMRRVIGNSSNDGVFANLSAKPSVRTEKPLEEHPPSYEQAAADATPPYWETTILAPGMSPDEVFIDGLPVGSVFAFVWNALISLSFQFIGFLLTYLLHTTHAAKNGSRAGLGITLVQYGFYMRGSASDNPAPPSDGGPGTPESTPSDPNSYDFNSGTLPTDVVAAASSTSSSDAITGNEWFSYVLMVVGWFILIRAVADFLRARRTEQLVLASPDRGLGVAVIAEGENPDRSV
ncbi:hypothetical protein TWF106_000446 [Orbilia oligospora]|uniref:Metal homeostatis protein bsd2 n=1 Tax=Orbilia oligospora TaxID=2813651 RepID=A0A7C8UFI7_ORBOL|nr:hypothetical protein TWF106_000446 [Orbilia oligospora]KAF3218362.1 hypothetical protein TWF679_000889 [Orbilia oligospora]